MIPYKDTFVYRNNTPTITYQPYNFSQTIKNINFNVDFSKTNSLDSMFKNMFNLTNINCSNGNLTNVEVISNLFDNCNNIKTLDVKDGNTQSITNFSSAFLGMKNLNTLDISNGKFNNEKINISFSALVKNCSNLSSIELFSIPNQIYNAYLGDMFNGCTSLINVDLSKGNLSRVKSIQSLFCNCQNLRNIKGSDQLDLSVASDGTNLFYNCYSLTDVDFNFLTKHFNHYGLNFKLTNTFYNCQNLSLDNFFTSFNRNCKIPKELVNTFYNCKQIINIDITNGNESGANTTHMIGTFSGCSNLEYFNGQGTARYEMTNFNRSNLKQGSSLFENCTRLKELKGMNNGTFGGVFTSAEKMFFGCRNLTNLNFRNFANIRNFRNAFASCHNLTSIDIGSIHTLPNLTTVQNACSGCYNFTQGFNKIVRVFDQDNVTNGQGVFSNCRSLTIIDEYGFNASGAQYGTGGFQDCYNLTNFSVGWITNNVKYFNNTFANCNNLRNIQKYENGNVCNVTTFAGMFSNCCNLININLSNGNPVNVTSVAGMFKNCNNLSSNSINSILLMLVNAPLVTYKNLNNKNTYSPFNSSNISINNISFNSTTINTLISQGGIL